MRKMRKTMQAIDQKGSIIIPFLLTISPQNHALCLESKITQEFSHKSENELPKNIKGYVDEQIHKYQTIQSHLIKECKKFNFNILEININHFEDTIEKMHDSILNCIE